METIFFFKCLSDIKLGCFGVIIETFHHDFLCGNPVSSLFSSFFLLGNYIELNLLIKGQVIVI